MAIARATCTCGTCGKTFEYRTEKRNRREADQFEAWAVEHITECSDCRKIRLAEEAEEARAEKGWPTLTGSEKQVAWANSIRDKQVAALMSHYRPRPGSEEEYNRCMLDFVIRHPDARYWIDRQDFKAIAESFVAFVRDWTYNK